MFPDSQRYKKQTGSVLAIAVFIIVAMSILSVTLSRLISSSSEQVSYEVLGTRAKLAAESGLEIMLGQLFPIAGTGMSCSPDVQQHRYFTQAGLRQCNVLINCAQTNPSDGASYYHVEATGVCKPTLLGETGAENVNDYACGNSDPLCVSRRLEVEAKTL